MGRFKAVVFDWAGTTIDYGSFAPAAAFREAFARFDIETSIDEARAPMGLPKWKHIEAMLAAPATAARWQARYGALPTSADVERIYEVFVPLNEEVAAHHADLVPGTLDCIAWLRARGFKIGSTTGYTRSIMAKVVPVAAAAGYAPDNLVCSDDLKEGRPGPLGMYQCFVDLAVYPPQQVIKVDDTAPGLAEGVAAGALAVGVALSGNEVGLTPQEVAALDTASRAELRAAAGAKLKAAGAAYVIDTVADLPALIEKLEAGG
ncbi:MAG: phosphonoacetaldehyde hydrolase [Pseudomonadota bacterium]